jgi:putative spermidine/putrescine transport system permease protein
MRRQLSQAAAAPELGPEATAVTATTGTAATSSERSNGGTRRRRNVFGAVLFYATVGFFLINLVGLVGTVVVDSFGDAWFNTWLPTGGYSGEWYQFIGGVHDIRLLLVNTLVVAVGTTLTGLAIGFPAAYVLARRRFRFKGALTGLYLVPMLVPPLAYGVPLATLLLKYLGTWIRYTDTTLTSLGVYSVLPVQWLIDLLPVIVINLVPVLPFVILILTPFVEQVDTSLESASRMLGASQFQTFRRVLLPLILPGLLTAGILAVVRTVAMFELTYLVASTASQQVLITALYGDTSASGITPQQAIDALSVIYMLTTMSLLVIALLFVKPTQFVVRVKATR